MRPELDEALAREQAIYDAALRKAGYCPNCNHYIGRGRNVHEEFCTGRSTTTAPNQEPIEREDASQED